MRELRHRAQRLPKVIRSLPEHWIKAESKILILLILCLSHKISLPTTKKLYSTGFLGMSIQSCLIKMTQKRKRNVHITSLCWVSHQFWVTLCPFLDSSPQSSPNNEGVISRPKRPFVLFNRSMSNATISKQLLPILVSFHPFKGKVFCWLFFFPLGFLFWILESNQKHLCKKHFRLIPVIQWNVFLHKEEWLSVCMRRGKKRHLQGLAGTADLREQQRKQGKGSAHCRKGGGSAPKV